MGSLPSKLGVAQVDKHGETRPVWAKLLDPAGVVLRETALYTYEQEISMRYSEPIDTDADDTGEDALDTGEDALDNGKDALDSTPELDVDAETEAGEEMRTQGMGMHHAYDTPVVT